MAAWEGLPNVPLNLSKEWGPLMTTPHSKRKTSSKEYGFRKEMEKVFKSWDPDTLRYTVQWLMAEAKGSTSGAWVQCPLEVHPGLGIISLDFDGEGGILINPETLNTAKGKELAQCLRIVMGEKVRVGVWGAA